MKILYIAHERKLGGASLSLVTLADEMRQRGHTVAVVLPFLQCPLAKELRRRKIKTYWVFCGWWMMPSDWPIWMRFMFKCLYWTEGIPVRIIAGIIRRNGYQIVHSNSSVIDVGSRAARLAGVPHVWHFREFAEQFYGLKFIKGREKSLREIINGDDYVIFISKCLAQYFQCLAREGKSRVIYNGVDRKYLNYHEHNRGEKIIFLAAGNLHPNKRQDLLLQAVIRLKEWDVSGFSVWIAGSSGSLKNSKDYEKKLRETIQSNHLDEVEMLGRITDMNTIRRQVDVEIVCSTGEAFGRVTVEAMLSGNPVLVSDSGANPELVLEGENGWLFGTGDVIALAKKMRWIIENPDVIERCGERAYHYAEKKFLSTENSRQIEMLYHELGKISF